MNTTAQITQALKKSATQIKQEPLELLKAATRQVTGETLPVAPQNTQPTETSSGAPPEEVAYKKKVAEQDGRHLQALEAELKDIRRQKLFNELLKRIQGGEDVPLEEFGELSFEQKDVLKAQMEAVKNQKLNAQNSKGQLAMPSSKKGRKMGGGQKGAAKKEETRVEKPVPPSG